MREREREMERGNVTKPKSTNYGGVMVIVVGNGHGDTSSNPGPD